MTAEQQAWLDAHQDWVVVTAEQHHRDYAAACNGRRKWPFDRLLCPDGTLLPGDAMGLSDRIYVRPPDGQKRARRYSEGGQHG